MNAIDLLATSLHRKDDVPNKELARVIISSANNEWVKELVTNLNNKDKNIQSDCIKVLYEIGEQEASTLIAPFWKEFITILTSKNNRLIWGAMAVLNSITLDKPQELFQNISLIETAINKGSVITIDGGISVLAKLASIKEFREEVMPKLITQLAKCPAKQFPMYIEKSIIAMNPVTKEDFLGIIEIRYRDLDKGSQRKRVDKVLKTLKTL